ncbi:hypothetical protein N7488_004604 [Penicillium malachiteum]|nr:hypothetical protein N7488_004604 [Penicillium malachiteum]
MRADSTSMDLDTKKHAIQTPCIDAEDAETAESVSVQLRRVLWKIDSRLLPVLTLCYFLQFLDKSALGYAALLGIRADTGLVGDEYSWINSIFYFGYFFWSFPTSWLILRVPIGKYLAWVVTCWGAVLACHAACHNFAGFMVTRFFLGMLEASVAPGFSFLTGTFYKRKEQPLRHGVWFLGNSFAGLLGGVVSYGIGHIQDRLYTWQYLFIIFGSATSAIGIAMFWTLPDGPENAWFLSPEERLTAVERTKDTHRKPGSKEFQVSQALEAFKDPQAWLLSLNMLGCMLVNSGFIAFQGIIIAGFGYSGLEALLYQMPGAVTQIGLVVITSVCASYVPNCRCIMLASLSLVSIVGVLLVYLLDDTHRSAKLFGISIMGAYATGLPLSMSMVSSNIAGNAKKTTVSAMLFVSYCISNIISPQVFLTSEEPKYPTGIKVCLSGLTLAVVCAIVLRIYLQYRNSRTLKIERNESESSDGASQNEENTDWEIPGFVYLL